MRLFPRSLFGRLILLLLTGLVLAQFLSAFVLLRDRGQLLYESVRENLIVRTAAIVHMLDSLAPLERQRLLPLLTTPELRITLADKPLSVAEPDSQTRMPAGIVKGQLLKRLPKGTDVRVSLAGPVLHQQPPPMHRRHGPGDRRMSGPWAYMHGMHAMARFFHIQVQLHDDTWVRFERGVPERLFDLPARLLVGLAILLISVVLLSLIGVRWIVRPLRNLRKAAEGLGKDIRQTPLQETGPLEVAETAKAFNTMQHRLQNYIEERARILAAVSHDLKTPLTRILLRTDLMDDEELRSKIQTDLNDMESMVSATLDYMRGTEGREPSQPLDLMALLESIREDAVEAGAGVRLQGQVRKPFSGKPLALKRCIVNLVDNAVRYGKRAEIRIEDTERKIKVSVRDDGPGIPDESLEQVFDPFFRLEGSRSQHTGGTGLGLGIARNIARAHGGDLILTNLSKGGLQAELTLPR